MKTNEIYEILLNRPIGGPLNLMCASIQNLPAHLNVGGELNLKPITMIQLRKADEKKSTKNE